MLTKKFIAMTLFILSASILAEGSCGPGKIRFKYKGKHIERETTLCIEMEKKNIYVTSPNCLNSQCEQLQTPEKRPVDIGKYPGTVGSPGFKVCRELGGSPQIFEFQFSEKFKDQWKQSSRCIFKDDTFASNNLIMKLWKGLILE